MNKTLIICFSIIALITIIAGITSVIMEEPKVSTPSVVQPKSSMF